MSVELLINVTPQETRIATLENGVLQEMWIERSSKRELVGNIFKGRVVRVLPGMEAAFVDLGLERSAFLHISDIAEVDRFEVDGHGQRKLKNITAILHQDQEILVQVIKDPLGIKGARLTTQLTIASRHLVYVPNDAAIGVSSKIDDSEERERLRELLQEEIGEKSAQGFIVRTVAEGAGAGK